MQRALAVWRSVGVWAVSLFLLAFTLAAPSVSAEERIPVGVLVPLTGGGAAEGPFLRDAAELAFEEIHEMLARGGSDVRFDLIVEDTATTPQGALSAIESMAAAGVEVVVGPYSSSSSSGARAFANANEVLILSPSSTSPSLAIPDDYLFRLVTPDTLQGAAAAGLLDHEGFDHVIAFHLGDSYGAGMANALKDAFESTYGGTVELLPYDPDLVDYAAEVDQLARRVRQVGPDETAVMLIGFQPDGLNILGHARLNPTLRQVSWFGSKDALSPTFFPPHAPAEIGAFMADVGLKGFFPTPPNNPIRSAFEAKYEERFGSAPSPWALYMYDASWIAALSILSAGEYDGEQVRAVLPDVAAHYLGASGHKLLDANDDAAIGVYEAMEVRQVGDAYEPVTIGSWESGSGQLQLFE